MSNQPYIGLRPFERTETDIFFGREQHTDQLIDRLGASHFLAVVGTSGCGKSSLVKTGLIAGLEAGYLASATSHWRIVEMRPSNQPFQVLADRLFKELIDVLAPDYTAETLQQALQQGSLSLHELLVQHPLPNNAQLLIVCDQFEEIFRYFKKEETTAKARNFVSLLLASSKPYPVSATQISESIYVVISMRSDFLGDCTQFAGLAEAINQGLYLTPSLNAQQLRAAIEDPAFVFGGKIEPDLIIKLLEDAQNNQDQLPLLQHALMRLWNLTSDKATLTKKDYKAIGSLSNALSRHADEVYNELSPEQKHIAEILFRSLTERGDTQRDTRRPTPLAKIIELTGVTHTEVVTVIDAFRQEGRCFLMPPIDITLNDDSIIDISHESLIRQWQRLKDWTADEAESAKTYRRLEDKFIDWKNGKAGLLQSPELEIVLQWHKKFKPTETWAKRYGGNFQLAEKFLKISNNFNIAKNLILFSICLILIVFTSKKIYIQSFAPYLIDKEVKEQVKVQLEETNKVIEQQDKTIEESQNKIDKITNSVSNAIHNIPDKKTRETILLEINNANLFLKQGKKYFDQKDYKNALISFQKALEIDKKNKLALYYLGSTYKEIGKIESQKYKSSSESTKSNFESAKSNFDNYLSVAGDNKTNWSYYDLWVHFYLGEIYSSKEELNFDKAIYNYTQVIYSKPKDKNLALAWYRIGILYQNQGQLDQAFLNFKNYTDVVTDSKFGYYHLGLVSEELSKGKSEKEKYYNEAIGAYTKAIHFDDKNVDAKRRLEQLKNPSKLYRK